MAAANRAWWSLEGVKVIISVYLHTAVAWMQLWSICFTADWSTTLHPQHSYMNGPIDFYTAVFLFQYFFCKVLVKIQESMQYKGSSWRAFEMMVVVTNIYPELYAVLLMLM